MKAVDVRPLLRQLFPKGPQTLRSLPAGLSAADRAQISPADGLFASVFAVDLGGQRVPERRTAQWSALHRLSP